MWNFPEQLVLMGCGHSASKYVISEVNLNQNFMSKNELIRNNLYVITVGFKNLSYSK